MEEISLYEYYYKLINTSTIYPSRSFRPDEKLISELYRWNTDIPPYIIIYKVLIESNKRERKKKVDESILLVVQQVRFLNDAAITVERFNPRHALTPSL